jgi:hypothetical protein
LERKNRGLGVNIPDGTGDLMAIHTGHGHAEKNQITFLDLKT